MSENTLILINLSRTVFFISNILLDYSFLTPKRPVWFQMIAFAGTWFTTYLLRDFLTSIVTDPFLVGYILSLLYLVPFALVFKESFHAKLFVFPILSYILLAFYGVQRTYLLLTFIPLVLCTILIAFSYYLIAISIDQTKRHQQLELTSRKDSLTGLYNRGHMEQRIQEEHEQYQRTGLEFALIIVDIDLFKAINDRYGHAGGDYLLKSVSEDLRKSARDYDTVARWGGDEFLLLLPSDKCGKCSASG